jgi:hypothetical protein
MPTCESRSIGPNWRRSCIATWAEYKRAPDNRAAGIAAHAAQYALLGYPVATVRQVGDATEDAHQKAMALRRSDLCSGMLRTTTYTCSERKAENDDNTAVQPPIT